MKQILIFSSISAVLAVAITKYYFPTVQIKTVEVEKEVTHYDVHTVTHTVTTPNGTTDTTTVTDDHTKKLETDIKTAVVLKGPEWNVSGLVGNDFSQGLIKPIYGVSVSREILGPVTVGAFGLSNGVLGLSVGLNF